MAVKNALASFKNAHQNLLYFVFQGKQVVPAMYQHNYIIQIFCPLGKIFYASMYNYVAQGAKTPDLSL